MDEGVSLLLLQHLFPTWEIWRGGYGSWWAAGRVLVSASDVDGLLDLLAAADPPACRRAVLLLKEG